MLKLNSWHENGGGADSAKLKLKPKINKYKQSLESCSNLIYDHLQMFVSRNELDTSADTLDLIGSVPLLKPTSSSQCVTSS